MLSIEVYHTTQIFFHFRLLKLSVKIEVLTWFLNGNCWLMNGNSIALLMKIMGVIYSSFCHVNNLFICLLLHTSFHLFSVEERYHLDFDEGRSHDLIFLFIQLFSNDNAISEKRMTEVS